MIVGGVDTPMAGDRAAVLGVTLEDGDATVIGRTPQPDEIAAGVLFLASSESFFITGSPFVIDAGLLARIA